MHIILFSIGTLRNVPIRHSKSKVELNLFHHASRSRLSLARICLVTRCMLRLVDVLSKVIQSAKMSVSKLYGRSMKMLQMVIHEDANIENKGVYYICNVCVFCKESLLLKFCTLWLYFNHFYSTESDIKQVEEYSLPQNEEQSLGK